MKICHDQTGHMDATKTRDQIQRKFWWPSMSSEISDYVRSCDTCKRLNQRTTVNEGVLLPRDVPETPNSVISLDHFGPLHESNGNWHVLICIDHATRYVDAVAVPSTSSAFYLDFLTNRWVPRFGVPHTVITDQARGFLNKRTATVHRRLGVTHLTSPPYWPQANGLIERSVKTMKTVVRKLIDTHKNWDEVLQEAVFAINASKHKSTGMSPFYLMHGYEPTVPGQLNVGTVTDELEESHRLHQLAKSRQEARENLEQSLAQQKERYDSRRLDPQFKVGDKVFCTIGSRSSSLDPFFEGPFFIKSFKCANTVELESAQPMRGRTKYRTANIEQLRRHYERCDDVPELGDSVIGHALRSDLHDEQNFESAPHNSVDVAEPTATRDPDLADSLLQATTTRRYPERTRRTPQYLGVYDL